MLLYHFPYSIVIALQLWQSRGISLHDVPPPSPMKEDTLVHYSESDLGRLSNVDDVLDALRTDDVEHLKYLKVKAVEHWTWKCKCK